MRRLIPLLGLLLISASLASQGIGGNASVGGKAGIGGGASTSSGIVFINSIIATSAGNSTATSPPVDMTGANLCIIVSGSGNSTILPTTSPSNTWTLAKSIISAQGVGLYYSYAPTVSSSMTVTDASGFGVATLMCFSGSVGSMNDQNNGINVSGSATSVQPGSVTPGSNGEVIVEGLLIPAGSAFSVNSSYIQKTNVPLSAGQHYASQSGYLIQTTAAASNPTVSWTTGASAGGIVIGTFK